MFLSRVLRTYVNSPCVMLDLCAAPGGKSTLARSVLPEGSLLVSNEVVRSRAQVLAENMIKWGSPDVVVTNNEAADFAPFPASFDVILADVPCSGEGMFRKDAVAVSEWSPANVELCWQRQRRIVSDIWGCLKPGGLFVYSTCTFNQFENEQNVHWICEEFGAEVLPVPVDSGWGIGGALGDAGSGLAVCRFLPSEVRGEGFFLAVLRKPLGDVLPGNAAFGPFLPESVPAPSGGKRRKGGNSSRQVAVPTDLQQWLSSPEAYVFDSLDGILTAVPQAFAGFCARLRQSLRVLHAGVAVAEQKGRDWQPHHALALSTALDRSAFPVAELPYAMAVAYLRREAVVLDADVPRGYVLVTYRDRPLGFVKNVGNRANNLYPQEWRIRSGHAPVGEERVLG